MKRREFIALFGSLTGASLLGHHAPGWAQAVGRRASSASERILILVELKGGNDGLNTVVPYPDNMYYRLRNTIAIKREDVIKIDSRVGLHPALKAVLPLWEKGELAIVQGVGYPEPNLSHFRSIDIWATSSKSSEYLEEGWVSRAMKAGFGGPRVGRTNFTAEGVVIGGSDLGPLAGARAVALRNTDDFVNQAGFAIPGHATGNAALQHLLRVENDVSSAVAGLRSERYNFQTIFPQTPLGHGVRAAAQVVASQRGKAGVPVITLTVGSFDTHQGQLFQHDKVLRELGEGLAALRNALTELGVWDRTLVMTYSEFGRRGRENGSGGTDHGTAAPQFVTGGAVRGGLYGQAPDLARLDGSQNLLHSIDFRQLYTSVAQDWWGVNAESVVGGRFEPIRFLKA